MTDRRAAILVAVLAPLLLSRQALADGWDDKIAKAKEDERKQETDEERARREDREARDLRPRESARVFVFGGAGLVHDGRERVLSDITPALTLGGFAVAPLGAVVALQFRATLLVGPFAKYATHDFNGFTNDSYLMLGAIGDVTLRFSTASSFFVGVGPYLGAVKGGYSTEPAFGGVLELGFRLGAQRELELAVRSAVGSEDSDLFGMHLLTVAWSPTAL